MTLEEYIGNERGALARFAKEVGARRSTIHDLLSGRRKPSRELALRIEDATAGAVPVRVWSDRAA